MRYCRLAKGITIAVSLVTVILSAARSVQASEPAKLSVLLLGDKGHHNPAEFAKVIGAALGKVGVDITYTDKVEDLVPQTLNKYDAVAIFRDSGDLPIANEVAFVGRGDFFQAKPSSRKDRAAPRSS